MSQQLLADIVQLFTPVRPYTVAAFKTQSQNVVNDFQYSAVLLEAGGQTPDYLKQLDAAFTFAMKSHQQALPGPDTASPPDGVVGSLIQRRAHAVTYRQHMFAAQVCLVAQRLIPADFTLQ